MCVDNVRLCCMIVCNAKDVQYGLKDSDCWADACIAKEGIALLGCSRCLEIIRRGVYSLAKVFVIVPFQGTVSG